MRTCASCGRDFPEVAGAATQVCPHCGHETEPEVAPGGAWPRADPAGAAAQALRFAARRYPLLLLVGVPFLALQLVAGFGLDAYVSARGLDRADLTTGEEMEFLGVALPLLLLSGALQLAYWSVAAALVLDGGVGPRLSALARRWPALLGLGLLLTLLYVAGVALLLVPFLVFAHWFLFAPAAFADGAGVMAAFERSRAFGRTNRTHGFTALVVLLWGLGAIAAFLADALLAPRLGAAGPAASPIVTWLLLPFVATPPAAYWALARAAPDASRAQGARARASTACPRCGTLIPYASTGSPVDVTCPSCGTAGRVL